MRMMLTAFLLVAVLPAYAADEEVKLAKIKYEDLGKFVVAQKGKVVLVDFWATN